MGLNSISSPTRKLWKAGHRIFFFMNSSHFSHFGAYPCSLEGDGETMRNRMRSFRPWLPFHWCRHCSVLTKLTYLFSTHSAVSCSKAFGNMVPLSEMPPLSVHRLTSHFLVVIANVSSPNKPSFLPTLGPDILSFSIKHPGISSSFTIKHLRCDVC